MATRLVGKYEFETNEGVDQYLQALDVGLVFRKVQFIARPAVAIHYDPITEEWIYRNFSVFNQHELVFKLGKTVVDETFDARTCRTVAQLKNGKLYLEQTCTPGPNVIMTIEKTNDDRLKITHVCENYSCTHLYKVATKATTSNHQSGSNGEGEFGLPSEPDIVTELMNLEMVLDAEENSDDDEDAPNRFTASA